MMGLDDKRLNELFIYIKKNKKYKDLNDDLVKKEIKYYLKRNPKAVNFLDKVKSDSRPRRMIFRIRLFFYQVFPRG